MGSWTFIILFGRKSISKRYHVSNVRSTTVEVYIKPSIVNRFLTERFTHSGERPLLESLEKFNLKFIDQLIHLCSEDLVKILISTRTLHQCHPDLSFSIFFTRHNIRSWNFLIMISTSNLKLLNRNISSA